MKSTEDSVVSSSVSVRELQEEEARVKVHKTYIIKQ